MIRRELVDYARRRDAATRGGGQPRVALTPEIAATADGVAIDVLDLNASLEKLAAADKRAA